MGTDKKNRSVVATPVVRGSLIDAYVYETGTGYGSSTINLERKPLITIQTGRDAQLKPIIINGSIFLSYRNFF